MPPSDRRVLLRRLTFLLTGLPPTPDDVPTFLQQTDPDAVERLVDRLLASPRYAEHWAQHWLDVARFAETDGFEHDNVRAESWRYRDWVISAFDKDLPYNQFVTQQLAGDLLSSASETAVATSFCVAGPDMPDMNLQDERRHHVLNEMTGTVGAVFLGLQLGCAQCHDHKYDALSQADFYRLRAYFEGAIKVEKNVSLTMLANRGNSNRGSTTQDISDRSNLDAQSRVYARGDWRRPGPIVLASTPRVVSPQVHPLRSEVPARIRLAQEITVPEHPLTARVYVNRVWMQLFGEGLSRTPNDFGVMGDVPEQMELLDWLASEFVSEEGLAWSSKRLLRLVCLSSTFRSASEPVTADVGPSDPHQAEIGRFDGVSVSDERFTLAIAEARRIAELLSAADPNNRLLGRFPRRRLNGEAIRDAILFAGENLNYRRSGQGVFAPLPPELRESLLKNQWPQTPDLADHDRRSVFMFARRNLRFPLFDVFDRPDANASCAQRNRSTTALQALTLLNSDFSWQQASRLALTLQLESAGSQVRCIESAFWRTLGRHPSPSELVACQRVLSDTGEPDRALADLCLALFNLHEFVYIE